MTDGPAGGLLGMATALVAIPSLSHHEALLADAVETALRLCPWLTVDRVGDNLVARTQLGRSQRVIVAGHLDTVPPVDGNEEPRVVGDVLSGVGAADMKGGLAIFLHVAGSVPEPTVDVTWVFYVCEEVERRFNGLRLLWEDRPDLLQADAAILGEPTGGRVEAGCQGTLRIRIGLAGQRAHTARPFTGRNAVHRLAPRARGHRHLPGAAAGARRVRVRRTAPGGVGGGRRGRQRGTGPGHPGGQPPVRPRPGGRRRRRRRSATCSSPTWAPTTPGS